MSANYHFHIKNFVNVSNSDIQTAHKIVRNQSAKSIDKLMVKEILSSLENIQTQLTLEQEVRHELEAGMKAITSQLSLKRPRTNVIKACLWSLKSSMENAVSNAVAADVVHRIGSLLK
jgi:hypothetical protein